MSTPYLEFATAKRMQALLASARPENLKLRTMISWTYLVIIRESMLATCPDRYHFTPGFRRENTDIAGYGQKLAGTYLLAYEGRFQGPDELSGPLLDFFEAESAAFVAWASERGTFGQCLWQTPVLLSTVAEWYDDLSPSAPRQVWFRNACTGGKYTQLFADLESWSIFS